VKATSYTEEFLQSQHEFKFGVQFSKGSAKTNIGIGPHGTYQYRYNYYGYDYYYRAYQEPYQYGGVATDIGFFVDDAITVNERLTLNAGVRFDYNRGSIPDYDRLTVGEPSISVAGFYTPTGETVPGLKNLINWKLISPRLGFAYQPTEDGRSVIRGSFGIYYDQNVIGNWDAPAPDQPTLSVWLLDSRNGERQDLMWEWTAEQSGFAPDLKAPKALQYAIGFEQQLTDDISVGTQYVYKSTKDLIGWEIQGGRYEPFPFTDPFTGTQYSLLNAVERPVVRKGNDPGDFPGSEDMDYYQKYHGVLLTFTKRFSHGWSLNGSYTWSRSEGRIPRMHSQLQFNPFYGDKDGSDPNEWLNTDGRLQGDRPHMFRVQSVTRLPYDILFSTSVEFSSGRAHSRQIRVGGLEQGEARILMEPIGAYRYSPIQSIDLLIGKRFYVTEQAYLRLEGWIFNLLNSDQELFMATLRLQDPSEDFVPDTWMQPRRLQLRIGFYF
jgi:outer membrane receptor protein involved in Fe transport